MSSPREVALEEELRRIRAATAKVLPVLQQALIWDKNRHMAAAQWPRVIAGLINALRVVAEDPWWAKQLAAQTPSKAQPTFRERFERTPEGTINNCALANGAEERDCQVCGGDCPDRERFVREP